LLNTVLATFSEGTPPIPPSSYESIASANGTGASGIVTFSSIPATYKHLQLRCLLKDVYTSGLIDSIYLRFNGTTGSLYSFHDLNGDGTTAARGGQASTNEIEIKSTIIDSNASFANIMGVAVIDIIDYASTTKNKTLRSFSGIDANTASTSFKIELCSGLWRSTAAINEITIHTNIDRFTTTSVFALYGIKG
jgi:hypothetical protein